MPNRTDVSPVLRTPSYITCWTHIGLAVTLLMLTGCSTTTKPSLQPSASQLPDRATPVTLNNVDAVVRPVSHVEPGIIVEAATPFAGAELTAEELIALVLGRNPTVDEMNAVAAAAAARIPQVSSLDDPMLGFQTAPGSAGSYHADYAARVEVTQKLSLNGKRDLRGQIASAESRAAGQGIAEAKQQLVEAARTALADYYYAQRSLVIADENLKLLKEFRLNAETRYQNGLAPQQDLLQSDVELVRVEERKLAMQRARQIAQARINTLMHLPPDSPLPPPGDLTVKSLPLSASELRHQAVANRPELKAIADRIAADEAALTLAHRDYKPDVELLAAYDGFWQGADGRPLQWQVGARVNLPVRLARRDGAVMEAQAKLAQRRAELIRQTDAIGLQVQEAYEQVSESEKVIALYETKAMPAAAANVQAAQSAYATGKVPFLALVESQRNAITVRERVIEARAERFRRQALLDRAVGVELVSGSASQR